MRKISYNDYGLQEIIRQETTRSDLMKKKTAAIWLSVVLCAAMLA